ncbi:MAG TPA: DUF1778 domain-containing protein [Capsulimonadaceae bacterium]|jgi:uncharacterized protein (DUF1778 family)
MPKNTTAKPEVRLSIRANPSQKSVLARAASARHMNVSQFVLGASLREAEQIINSESTLAVSPEQYDWLVNLMDAPTSPKPALATAVRKPAVWDE